MDHYEKILEGIVKIISTTEKSDVGFVNIRDYIDETCPEFREREDEEIRKAILELVRQSSEILEKRNQEQMITYLEKQGKKKLEWSKEDERISKTIIINIENLQFSRDMQEKYHHKPNTSEDYYQIMIDWLKSLKDRVGYEADCTTKKNWRPSEKQIKALSNVLSLKEIKYDVLSELLKCLKKLK